ncbi:sigma-70 family RNA polymerase sigma factor [Rhodobacterales bacterium HKCCE4037]|nr:sigma-70 family RNA polymerase sigma factor [Rhodobacterales bacterium HKCCE4037]
MSSHEELEDLLARAGLGDRDAFIGLYDATSAKLLAVCLRVLKNRSSAEDAMQDAYVKIWNNADRYAVTGHSPMTWLITIARNTAIDRLRARRRTEPLDTHSERIAADTATPEQSAIAGSEARRVMACLDELEEDRGAAIRGAYLDGKTYKDLAEQFDVPLNTMRTWLRRGLIALRECMSR